MLVAASATLAGPRPAAAADDAPVVTISSQVGCGSIPEGSAFVIWTVSQNTYYGGEFTNVVITPSGRIDPDLTLYGTAPATFRLDLDWGHGATTASLSFGVLINLPSGPQLVNGASTVSLPFCPRRTRATVTFAKQCDGSVNVGITYPASAEIPAVLTVTGSVSDWSTDVTVSPGDVRTVTVPQAYSSYIRVDQDHSVYLDGQIEPLRERPGCPIAPLWTPPTIITTGPAALLNPVTPAVRWTLQSHVDYEGQIWYSHGAIGVETVERLVAEAAAADVREILLTGGEPFLLPDLDRVVHACVARLPTTMLTNGMLFRGTRLELLRRLPRDGLTLQISLDSATPGPHDRHRGAGTWQRAFDGIRVARAEGFRVRVAATVAPNEADADADLALRRMLDDMGIPAEDQVVRPVAQRGFATEGVALTVETLLPEVTVTADGVYWHPVGVDHPDQLVTRELFPLRAAIDEVTRRFVEYRRTVAAGADTFPCA